MMTKDELIVAVKNSAVEPTVQPAIINEIDALFRNNPNVQVTFVNNAVGLGPQLIVMRPLVTVEMSFYITMPL